IKYFKLDVATEPNSLYEIGITKDFKKSVRINENVIITEGKKIANEVNNMIVSSKEILRIYSVNLDKKTRKEFKIKYLTMLDKYKTVTDKYNDFIETGGSNYSSGIKIFNLRDLMERLENIYNKFPN